MNAQIARVLQSMSPERLERLRQQLEHSAEGAPLDRREGSVVAEVERLLKERSTP